MSLTGKTILITGAAGGLGTILALHCAHDGADLVLLDRNRKGLTELSDRFADAGLLPPGLYPLDLSGVGIGEFNDLASVLQSEYGGLDALIHCAADFDGLQSLEQVDPRQWLKSMQVNVNAPWLLSCTCLPLLKKSTSGRLFFLLDDPDTVKGAYWGPYGVAKFALTGLVQQFDESLSNTRVVTRGIYPGAMRTGFRAKAYHAENPMDQPEASIAAVKIVDMLTADLTGEEVLVHL